MKSLKIDIDWEVALAIVIAYLKDELKFWSRRRLWTEEENEFRKEYVAALKAILKCLR